MGGCVRDLILKRTPRDFDILTSAELREVAPPFSSLSVSSTQAYFILFFGFWYQSCAGGSDFLKM